MLRDVGKFSFLCLKLESSRSEGCLRFVVTCIIIVQWHPSNCVHLWKESSWTQLKTKSKNKKYPRYFVFLDLFMIWWINCEPENLFIVSNYIAWFRQIFFLKKSHCFHLFYYWKNLQFRIAMFCKGFINSYLIFDGIANIVDFLYNHNLGNILSPQSRGFLTTKSPDKLKSISDYRPRFERWGTVRHVRIVEKSQIIC